MKVGFVLIFTIFLNVISSFQENIYVQSNCSVCSDGKNATLPIQKIENAVQKLLSSSGGFIFLLPSNQSYTFFNYIEVNHPLFFKSMEENFPATLVFGNIANMRIKSTIEFRNLLITRKTPYFADNLFYLDINASFILEGVHVSNFTNDGQLNRFFQGGGNCYLLINNSVFNNNNLELATSFLELWLGSYIIINNTIFDDFFLKRSTFFKVWEDKSTFHVENSFFKNANLLYDNVERKDSAFLSTTAKCSFKNFTVSNVSTNKGAFITAQSDAKRASIIFSQCFFEKLSNYGTWIKPLFLTLINSNYDILLEDVQISNTLNYYYHGTMFFVKDGDKTNLTFKNVVIKKNFGLFLESMFARSINFTNVFIFSHNLLESPNVPCCPFYVSYIESTIYLNFINFIIDGAISDRDVGGLKIHINTELLARNEEIKKKFDNQIYFNLSFINCYFGNVTSVNKNWLDKGSGLVVHSDIFLNVFFNHSIFVDNINDLGSTCIEAYGQEFVNFIVFQSLFINNHASSGSSCLSLFIISMVFNESLFLKNSLYPKDEKINGFNEGVEGGVMYSESSITQFIFCIFKENAAYQGGVFYFYDTSIFLINISIINCTFEGNQAKLGGSVSVSNVLSSIYLKILSNYFINNYAVNGGCFFLNFYSDNSEITISNNTFTENNALKGGVAFLSTEGFNVNFISNIFSLNKAWNFNYLKVISTGGVFFISEESACSLHNYGNIYMNNTSYGSGGVFSLNRGFLSENQSTFENNYAFNQGGTIILKNSASCHIFSSNFKLESTKIWGGSISLTEDSFIYVKNVVFEKCYSNQGGVIFIENHNFLMMENLVFINNAAYEGAVALLYTSVNDVAFENCSFLLHTAQKSLFMATSSLGNIGMKNILLKDNYCNFFTTTYSKVILNDSLIMKSDCTLSTSACIIHSEESYVDLYKLTLIDNRIKIDGTLFYLDNEAVLKMQEIYIKNISGISKGSCLTSSGSKLYIINSKFEKIGYGCLDISYSFLNMSGNVFDNLNQIIQINNTFESSKYGSFIFLENTYNVSIIFSKFLNNIGKVSESGGAVRAINSLPNNILIINLCYFINNSASLYGGAIFLEGFEFIISASFFFINYCGQDGGAIYFSNQISSEVYTREIKENEFHNNSADIKGGAIYFHDNLINLTSNIFLKNQAVYGPDKASIPVFFKIKIYNLTNVKSDIKFNFEGLDEKYVIFDSFEKSFDNFLITNYPTGLPYNLLFVFELLDFFNQTIKTHNSGVGHITPVDASFYDKSKDLNENSKKMNNLTQNYDFDNKKIIISGVSDCFNKNGTFYFESLTIYATPTSYFNLFISNDALNVYYPQVNAKNFVQINNTIGIILIFSLRDCISGELYNREINYCSRCPAGKYSLNLKSNSCIECPPHATCLGGDKISIDQRYWRFPEKKSLHIYFCFVYPDSCLGGLENQCLDEYEGPICSLCKTKLNEKFLTRIGKYCIECLDDGVNTVFLLSLVFAFSVLIIIMIRSNLKVKPSNFITKFEDKCKTPDSSLLYKILIDHVQLLGINENIGFDVPYYFRMMNDVESGGVYFIEQLFSFDCFLKNTSEKFNLMTSIIFIRTAWVAFSPLVSIIIIVAFWFSYFILRRADRHEITNKCISSIVITIFLLQPTILNSMSRLISCIELGNENYVLADMHLKCWEEEHYFIVSVFALPSLFIWNLLFPLFCLLKISKMKKDLKSENTVLKFGFLYNGFDEKMFYWGFVKYFQKSIIILLRMSSLDTGIKMLTILLIWIMSVSWRKFHTAYVHPFLNLLEFNSNFINLISLFLSLYVLFGVIEEIKSMIFVILVSINIYFLVIWLKFLIIAKQGMIKKTISKITEKIRKNLVHSYQETLQNSKKKKANFKKTPNKVINKVDFPSGLNFIDSSNIYSGK